MLSTPDLPAWQTGFQRVLDAAHEYKFVQVATVTEDGRPACRTMGFCGFIPGTQQALLQTHAKSFKAGQLAKSNWIEICNWNLQTQQQFRLRGTVTAVDADNTQQHLQEIRQKEYCKLDTPSVLQWYNNADRAPGRPFQPPAQHSVHREVITLTHQCT